MSPLICRIRFDLKEQDSRYVSAREPGQSGSVQLWVIRFGLEEQESVKYKIISWTALCPTHKIEMLAS